MRVRLKQLRVCTSMTGLKNDNGRNFRLLSCSLCKVGKIDIFFFNFKQFQLLFLSLKCISKLYEP